MIWVLLLGFSLAFAVPIIILWIRDRKLLYAFYALHILLRSLFIYLMLVKFSILPLPIDHPLVHENINVELRYLGISGLLYFWFLELQLKEFDLSNSIQKLPRFLTYYLLFHFFIIMEVAKFLTHDNTILYYVRFLGTLPIYICIGYLVYKLIKYRSVLIRSLAFGLAAVSLGDFLGLLCKQDILCLINEPNPYLIISITTIFEFASFNFVVLESNFKKKERLLVQEEDLRNKISVLQTKALQAQMNPHFIFNCLNSIQSYIMSNDKDKAMEYLALFARLIRQNLKASSESQVALDIEISMLENYLKLERMRFHQSFEYKIAIDENISIQEVIIPPLIIQPYVENAILHGMKQKKGDGLIELSFTQIDDFLHIKIKDNGTGIDPLKDTKSTGSMGMSITKNRLENLNKLSGNNYSLKTYSDENGTIISLSIKTILPEVITLS